MEMQTARIDGLAPSDGKRVIERALGYLYRPDAVLEHVWNNGDFVIWDNIAKQHARGSLAGKGRRTLQKVEAGGVALESWPGFHSPEEQELQIGRAHVGTQVNNGQIECRLLVGEQNKVQP